MTSTPSTSARLSHGFEDVLSQNSLNNALELNSRRLTRCKPRDLRDRDFYRKVWAFALGKKAPAYKQVHVVGRQDTLKEWAPYCDKTYPSFVKTVVYEGPPDEEDEDNEEEPVPVLCAADRKLIVLLPGDYDWQYLWKRKFTGINTIVGVGENCPTVYNGMEDEDSMVHCKGKTCLCGLRFEDRAGSCDDLISTDGQLRLVGCVLMPQVNDSEANVICENGGWEAGAFETGDLIRVNHGASLVAELAYMGPSSLSCIQCQGQCVVYLSMCELRGAGRGDRVQRSSKVTGQTPTTPRGFSPAIAVSYAATIQVNKCQFLQNYGYPIQFTSKDEQDGTVGQYVLDQDSAEYARDLVNCRIASVEEEGFPASYYDYDVTTKDGKEQMYQELLAEHQQRKTKLALKRTKGSVEITPFNKFDRNATSPLLPDLPEGYRAIIEPWFADNSKMRELVDEDDEPLEEYERSDEAVKDRKAWQDARPSTWFGDESRELSPAATLFQSLMGGDGVTDTIAQHLQKIMANSDPNEYFSKQRRQARNPFDFSSIRANMSEAEVTQFMREIKAFKHTCNEDSTAYGMLDDEEICSLRESMRHSIDESISGICDAMKRLTDSPHVVDLARIFWGRFTVQGKYHQQETRLVAEAGILALQSKLGGNVSPYRAAALVELMECDVLDEGTECPCNYTIPPGQCTAFILGLSHDSVVTALFAVLKDHTASDHGRKNAGTVLMSLAFAKPDLRGRVIAGLSDALSDESELSLESRQSLVKSLACLHARESADIVRDASMKGKLANEDCGYIDFLRLVGLSIDLTDEAVLQEVNNPTLLVPRNATDEEVRENIAGRAVRTRKEIAEHNATLCGRPPCNHCGTKPPKGEEFPRCTRCHKAYYCGRECQRAAWKEHKKECTRRKKGSKK